MSTTTSAQPAVPASSVALERSNALRYLVPLGRALFALIFVTALPAHLQPQSIEYSAQAGVPVASILVPLSGIIAGIGGLSVLLGYRARIGAFLLVVFLVPVTVMMHNFWAISDASAAQMQMAMFMKNLALLGGAILLMYFGAGPLSLDQRREVRA